MLTKIFLTKENKINFKYTSSLILIFLFVFFLDRITKVKVLNLSHENEIFINNYLNLNLVWNTGIGFGLFSFNANFIYHTITFIIASVIVYLFYLTMKSEILQKISLTIILGGAVGNLYDRIVFFAVPDFIDLHYKNFHWFTFNVADIFITFGILLYLTLELLNKNEK